MTLNNRATMAESEVIILKAALENMATQKLSLKEAKEREEAMHVRMEKAQKVVIQCWKDMYHKLKRDNIQLREQVDKLQKRLDFYAKP